MTVIELLARLNEKNVELSVKEDDLVVRGQEQVLETPELLDLLRKNKKELVEYIRAGKYIDHNGIVHAPPNRIPPACKAIMPEMLSLIALTQPEIDALADMTPGGAANIQDIYPLAPLQEGILFHHLMNAEGDAYLASFMLAFDTRERLDSFVGALQAVIDRHDILRTAVVWEGLPEPAQVVWRKAALSVEDVDLDAKDGEIARQLRSRFDPRNYRLDVRQAPLIRSFAAYDEIGERWLLLCLNHHLTIDHTTLEIMTREAQAHLSGDVDQLPEPLPFRNLVAQARLGISREEHEAFFREMLGDVDEPTTPFGLIDARGDGAGIEEAQLELEMGLSGRLREKARILRVSAAGLCHLAWGIVLARVSGLGDPGSPMSKRDGVVFGTVLFGRMQGGAGADRTLGLFINTLPIRIHINEESVESSARRVHRLLAELIRHEHASLALAQKCSGVEAPAPLFSALLNYRHSPRVTLADAKAVRTWTGIDFLASEERTNYPLMLSVDDLGDGFTLTAQAAAPVDSFRVCDYMRMALERLVEALEKAPETPVRAIDALPEVERRQVVEEWNATEADYPKGKLIHELFEEQVEKSPQAVALVYEAQSLTYGELNASANLLAHHLRKLGVGPEARVAICLEPSLEMVVALLATLKAGGAYAPLDPAYPSERLAYMLEDSEPVVLLTNSAARVALSDRLPAIPILDLGRDAAQWASQSKLDLKWSDAGPGARSLAYIIYTSGSTGLPKGVMVEHGSVVNLLCSMRQIVSVDPGDCVLGLTTLAFDIAGLELYLPLISGARIELAGNENRHDPEALAERMARAGVTAIQATPATWRMLLEVGCKGMEGVKALCGGEALQAEQARRIRERVGKLWNVYGPTETTIWSTVAEVDASEGVSRITIGRPIANTSVYILDPHLCPAPIGVAAEVHIGGAGIAWGYLNHPELTAERFLPDPFSREAGVRIYKTGDMSRWRPKGEIEFLGRNDFQVKIRGFRIELGEIETRLINHPAVREVVALAREEGAGGQRLVAYYTGEEVGAEVLRAYLTSALPGYMAPSAYVWLEKLPLTPNGKLDRRKLPAPEGGAYPRGYEAPKGETEIRIARIWAETLKVERVGRHDNFFELGGHSLLAITMVERMRGEGMKSDVQTLFAAPTLRELAEAIKGGAESEAPTPPNLIPEGCQRITPEMLTLVELTQPEIDRVVDGVAGGAPNIQDIYPLAPMQEGMLFHHLLDTEGDVYLSPSLFAFDTRERLERFVEALQAVIDRHDILRTAVQWEGVSEPVQVVWRQAPLAVEEVRLDPTVVEVAEELYARFNPRLCRLDVRKAPLMRVYIAHEARNGRWMMMCLFHHLWFDHTTLEVLQREIQSHLLGRTEQSPEPPPFRNFVAKARLGVSHEEHEKFFRQMLGDVDEPTAPYGLIDAQGDGSGISQARREVDAELNRRLRQAARALRVSAASLCHLAWALTLGRVSRRDDVVFGTILFGRLHGVEGADRALGMLINTLPIRIRIGTESVAESARRTHQSLTELMTHEQAPLSLAQKCSGVEAPAPLFSSLFNYRYILRETQEEASPAWEGIEILASEERTNYPLVMSVDDLGDGLALTAETAAQIDPWRICDYMLTALEGLVEALVAAPEMATREIEVMPEAERRQVLENWNVTEADYPAEKLIHQLFEEQADRAPDRIAGVNGDVAISYGELNRRANQLGNYLRRQGVGVESRMGIFLERGVEMLEAILGIMKAGGTYAPLDPAYPAERLKFMQEDSAARLIVTQEKIGRLLGATTAELIRVDSDCDEIAREDDKNINSGVESENLAYVIYTSGSTGRPKGTMITHRSVVNLVTDAVRKFRLESESKFLQFASLSFDVAVEEIYPVWSIGGGVVLLSDEESYSYSGLTKTIERHEVSTVELPTAYWREWMRELLMSGGRAPRCLDMVITGDERITVDVLRKWKEHEVSLLHVYGVTECTVNSMVYQVPADFREEVNPGAIPIGKPIANTEAYLLDGGLEPTPLRIPGELYLGGVGVGRGYLKRPEVTAERYVPSPFGKKAGERLYKSGDLARSSEDGLIEFIGRTDTQVKLRGYRIELGEIELQLARHPGIREAVAMVREDNPGDKRLVAYYTGAESNGSGAKVEAESLIRYLSTALPEYMIPAAYLELESLPLTPNGKLDRRALPQPNYAGATREYEAPVGDTEATMARIWAETLRLDRVGRHDNFFRLGGHSLVAIRLIEQMRSEGLQLDVRTLFITPTIAGLAAGMEEMKEIIL